MRTFVMLRVGIEIAELESGKRLLTRKRCDQRLFEHFLTLVSGRIARGKGRCRRVGFPMLEMIEHRCIDSIEVPDTPDMQAQSERISRGYAGGGNVARYVEIADSAAEGLESPLRGQRQAVQLGRRTRDRDVFWSDSVVQNLRERPTQPGRECPILCRARVEFHPERRFHRQRK